MKTLITLLTATTLFAGVTTAMADQQASDEATSNTLVQQVARNVSGPSASARVRGEVRNSTVIVPSAVNAPSTIDFQAQGSH